MNEFIIKEIANELNIKVSQVENTLKLLSEGNTIPFIARYRKSLWQHVEKWYLLVVNNRIFNGGKFCGKYVHKIEHLLLALVTTLLVVL